MIINPYVFGGGGGATPSDIANIWEWWEPSRDTYNNNDPVSLLTGQVSPGVGHNWVQATGTAQPVYLSNQLNGLGIVDFPHVAGGDYLSDVNPSALTAAHFFIVLKVDNDPPATAQVPWKFGTSGSTDHFPFTDSNIYCGAFSTTRQSVGDPAASLASWRVYEIVSTSSEYTALLDGTQLFTTGTNTVGILATCTFGSNLGVNPWDGQVAGLYIFSAKLTTDRADMVTYLNSRFGLSIV